MATEFDFVTAAHFRAAPDRAAARRLFKDSVTAVEIEIFSYCNRRCCRHGLSLVARFSRAA